MKILDIIYPYFTFEHDGAPFEVKEIVLDNGRFYEPSNINRDLYALESLIKAYDGDTIQTMIRATVEAFEDEMALVLNTLDVEGDLTYSERYILNMEGH